MQPVSPVIPGFIIEEVVYANNQPEYLGLPAWKGYDGTVVSRWKLTWTERLLVLFTGNLWLTVLTFNKRLQPVKLDATCPIQASFMLDKEV